MNCWSCDEAEGLEEYYAENGPYCEECWESVDDAPQERILVNSDWRIVL